MLSPLFYMVCNHDSKSNQERYANNSQSLNQPLSSFVLPLLLRIIMIHISLLNFRNWFFWFFRFRHDYTSISLRLLRKMIYIFHCTITYLLNESVLLNYCKISQISISQLVLLFLVRLLFPYYFI